MKLYELTNEWVAIDALLSEANGELTPEIENALDLLHEELPAKVEACCMVIRQRLATAKAQREEMDRLAELAEANEKAATRLKKYLMVNLEKIGLTKLETPLFKVRIQRNPPSVSINDPEQLPGEFTRVRVEPDKAALLDAWRSGSLPAGVEITQSSHLRIN